MPRPRRSRRKPRRTRPILWMIPLGFVAALLLVVLCATLWAQRYLRSDAFRRLLDQHVSQVLGVEGGFAPFSWTEASVYSDHFQGRGLDGGVVEDITGQGIRAVVDLGSFRREAWEVERVTINHLVLNLGSLSAPGASSFPAAEPESAKPSYWSRWLPRRVEVGSIRAKNVDLRLENGAFLGSGRGMAVTVTPMMGSEGWSFHAQGGELVLGEREPMLLDGLQARLRDGECFITEAKLKLLGQAALTTSGEISGSGFGFRSHLSGLRAERVLRADWRQRVSGTIDTDFETEGSVQARDGAVSLTHSGTARLKQGVLTALPLLEELADHTRTERFRTLVLDHAEAPFHYYRPAGLDSDAELRVELSLRSDGLFQLSGVIHVSHPFDDTRPRPIAGELEVGVAKGVLRWLPGAEGRVFNKERSGYLFTTMRLGGTLENPEEDLSPRLGKAAVAETVEAVPDTAIGVGRGVLDTASGLLGPQAGGLLNGLGGQVLDETDRVVNEGLRMVPLLDLGDR